MLVSLVIRPGSWVAPKISTSLTVNVLSLMIVSTSNDPLNPKLSVAAPFVVLVTLETITTSPILRP